jgi:hypothetical protein
MAVLSIGTAMFCAFDGKKYSPPIRQGGLGRFDSLTQGLQISIELALIE